MGIGDRLPNGAIVLDFNENAILALFLSPTTPYVTWRWYEGDTRSTSIGHYFRNIQDAIIDYEKRK